MPRSRIALLQRTMDVVFGDTKGTHSESGWARGTWVKHVGAGKARKVNVCLNSALFVAERDVYGLGTGAAGGDDGETATVPHTDEGLETQALLAETIIEMYPAQFADETPSAPQFVIIKFNDDIAGSGDTSAADDMEAVLLKVEDKAYSKWLEDHPDFDPMNGPAQSFIDYAVEGGVS
jgi:hypothetical protein